MNPFITGALVGAGMTLGNVFMKAKNRDVPIDNWLFFFISTGIGGAIWGLIILGPLFWIVGNLV